MIDQAPIVRYTASVYEIFFSNFQKRLFQQNQIVVPGPTATRSQARARTLATSHQRLRFRVGTCQVEEITSGVAAVVGLAFAGSKGGLVLTYADARPNLDCA